MRKRAAKESHLRQPRHRNVRDKTPFADQVSGVLLAGDPGTNSLPGHFLMIGTHPAAPGRENLQPRPQDTGEAMALTTVSRPLSEQSQR